MRRWKPLFKYFGSGLYTLDNLKMVAFISDKPINELEFYRYNVISNEIVKNKYSLIRSAVRRIQNKFPATFCDNYYIYSLCELDLSFLKVEFSLEFIDKIVLDVLQNSGIYAEVIKYYILENIKTKQILKRNKPYSKYSARDEVSTVWVDFKDRELTTLKSDDRNIILRRVFNFKIEINKNKKIILWLNITHNFKSKYNIYDLMKDGKNVVGFEVFNKLNESQKGVVININEKTVSEKLPNFTSLKEYYINTGQYEKIKQYPDDTPVIDVQLRNGHSFQYYPQMLLPIITREYIAENCKSFSIKVDKHIKLNMTKRRQLDFEFINDIGIIKEIGNIAFKNDSYVELSEIGFKSEKLPLPLLTCGRGQKISADKQLGIFSKGFYSPPPKKIKFSYFYPKNYKEKARIFAVELIDFLKKGKYGGRRLNFIKENLIDLEVKAVVNMEYNIGDTLGYRKIVSEAADKEAFDIAIVVVPKEEDETYTVFKKEFAKVDIPSQMVSINTIDKFISVHDINKRVVNDNGLTKDTLYFIHNIVLGILSKTGGIPWIIENIAGNIDCYIGIDVSMVEKGIHYPASSIMLDRYGNTVGYYKPKVAQKGEKIYKQTLIEILDEVLLTYSKKYGKEPESVMIHRDGFSNEEDFWYDEYFNNKGIDYNIVEIRKFVFSKMALETINGIVNPTVGSAIYNDREGFLVTTNIKSLGSPDPLHIKRIKSNLDMKDIMLQILALSYMHIGSTKKLKLPITTGYADKICKNIELIPGGKFESKLFFL